MEASKHLKNYSTTIKFSNFVIHRGKHSGHYGMKITNLAKSVSLYIIYDT